MLKGTMSKRSMTYKYKDVRSDLNVKGDSS